MRLPHTGRDVARRTMAAVVAASMIFSPMPAVADEVSAVTSEVQDLEAQVDAARKRLGDLQTEAEQRQYELQDLEASLRATEGHIAELDAEIPIRRAELDEAKGVLSGVVADSYKRGPVTLLDIVVGAQSFDDLIQRITYANKVAEFEKRSVETVKTIAADLDQKRSDLEGERANKELLVVQSQNQFEATQEAALAAQAYYNDLSEELKLKIKEKEEAEKAAAVEAARVAAEEAKRRAEADAAAAAATQAEEARRRAEAEAAEAAARQQEEQQQTPAPQPAPEPEPTPAPQPAPQPQPEPTPAPQPEPEPAPAPEPEPEQEEEHKPRVDEDEEEEAEEPAASGPEAAASASAMVAQAYSIIGAGYQWSGYSWTGDVSSSAFTCSGVVDYSLGLSSQSNSPESLYASVSNMVSSPSQLSYGDLCFYSYGGRYPGHVGIYVGGGMIIDSIPDGGVALRSVDYMDFIGGGSIF